MEVKKIKPVGIGGVARAGKDTLFKLLERNLENVIPVKRIALADELKSELDPFLIEKFGISAFTSNTEEKERIRPLLVAYAKIKRTASQGTYWTSKIDSKVKECISSGVLPIITDIRYFEYQDDEVSWLRSFDGILIHLTRIDKNGHFILPANSEEEANDPKINKAAELCVVWNSSSNDLFKDLDQYGVFVSDQILRRLNG